MRISHVLMLIVSGILLLSFGIAFYQDKSFEDSLTAVLLGIGSIFLMLMCIIGDVLQNLGSIDHEAMDAIDMSMEAVGDIDSHDSKKIQKKSMGEKFHPVVVVLFLILSTISLIILIQ